MSRKPHCDNLPFEDLYFLPSSSSLARPATLHSSCNSPSSLPAYDSLGTQTDSYNMSPTSAADCPCAPCIKTRERCHRCKTTAAENSALLKKLEIYENKHAAKQERNTCFIITLLAFAFCFWVSTVAFTNHQGYMIVSWMALGPACIFMMGLVDDEYVDRGVPSHFGPRIAGRYEVPRTKCL